MSLQLEKISAAYQEKTYTLMCNMAALEDLEAIYGGMKPAMEDSVDKVSAALFLCMLNRARRKQGEPDVTREELSEEYSYAMIKDLDIFGMFIRALSPEAMKAKLAADAAENTPEGN